MAKTIKVCKRCKEAFIAPRSYFEGNEVCKLCLWWIQYYQRNDAPRGVKWDYYKEPTYISHTGQVLPDKNLYDRIMMGKRV